MQKLEILHKLARHYTLCGSLSFSDFFTTIVERHVGFLSARGCRNDGSFDYLCWEFIHILHRRFLRGLDLRQQIPDLILTLDGPVLLKPLAVEIDKELTEVATLLEVEPVRGLDYSV